MPNIPSLGRNAFLGTSHRLCIAFAFVSAMGSTQAQTMLVSESEASRPNAPELMTRGITRGPGIKMVGGLDVSAKSFSLKFEFEPRGGSRIDPKSVRLEYLKQPLVDLTERVKTGIHDQVLEILQYTVPPGSHALRVRVSDSEGREAMQLLTLQAK
jgi:hypothetical protein